jgi:hypothetical protein
MTEAQELANGIYKSLTIQMSSHLRGLSQDTLMQHTKQFMPNESKILTNEVNSWLHTLINRVG